MTGVGQSTDEGGPAPAFVVSTDDVPERERFDYYWSSLQAMLCPLSMERERGTDFHGRYAVRPLGAVTRLDFQALGRPVVRRTPADIARGGLDMVYLYQQLGPCGTNLRTAGNPDGAMAVGDFMIGHVESAMSTSRSIRGRSRAFSTGFGRSSGRWYPC